MKLEWDRQKNSANVEKHGLDFADAYKVFEFPMLVKLTSAKIMAKTAGLALG